MIGPKSHHGIKITEIGDRTPGLLSVEDKVALDGLVGTVTLLQGVVSTLSENLNVFAGGTTGQVLKKKSNDDFDVEWVTET